jgi:hypothetical protein
MVSLSDADRGTGVGNATLVSRTFHNKSVTGSRWALVLSVAQLNADDSDQTLAVSES